jgi:hypothetical protein
MSTFEVAVERDPFGKPRDRKLAEAEAEGRLVSAGRPKQLSLSYNDAQDDALDASLEDEENYIEDVAPQAIDVVTTLQAASEGVVVDADTIEFMGERFKMGQRIGLMPLLKFAHVSNKGVQADDMAGLAAMYEMIKDCIAPNEWERFERIAIEKQAESEDLLEVVSNTIEVLSARPTRQRSGSSTGSRPTSASSKVSSIRPAPEGLSPL